MGGGAGACKTSQLAFSTSGGMAEGELIVNLKNTGSITCTLKGFPGADLKGKDGTVSARRSTLAPVPVSVKPGDAVGIDVPVTDGGGRTVTVDPVGTGK
ncbi:DUF4232 domain-containing protein [Streptomyces sp. NPDC046942]|uniref:DUF4232 domain-containing protein n=1 Tax=Streptomyces sp. NPDC046942 TaxID=3155137 RepID=UPI003409F688